MLKRLAAGASALIGLVIGLLVFLDVPTAVTAADRIYAGRILAADGYDEISRDFPGRDTFEGQLQAILAVQDAVLKASPRSEGIPLGHEREPKDLFELGTGLCFDRSRAIEKILRYLGLETRHVAIYSTADRSGLAAFVTPDNASHALSEVKTQKGWMLVDSNLRWVGLDAGRNPVSVAELAQMVDRSGPWAAEVKQKISWIFKKKFMFILGLYSRHGKFYPPYTPAPELNLREFAQNFL